MNDFEKIEQLFSDVWVTAQVTSPTDVTQRNITIHAKMRELLEILRMRGVGMTDGNFEARPLINQQVGTIEQGAQVTGVKIDKLG